MTIRRSMMLMEAARLRALILEAREDGLIKRFVPIIVKNMAKLAVQIPGARAAVSHYMDRTTEGEVARKWGDLNPADPLAATKAAHTAIGIIHFVLDHDPDPKKSFSTWMMVMFTKGLFNLEDMPRVVDALNQYAEAKKANLIPRNHDLGTVKSPDDLYEMVKQFRADSGNEIVDRAYEATMYQQADVLIDSAEYKMISPHTREAAQWFGRHTEWCTAWGGQHGRHETRGCLYDQYANRGRLYIIQRKSDGKLWQFHRESNSYMDADDRAIDLSRFVQENPEIAHWFAQVDTREMGHQIAEIDLPKTRKTMRLYDNGDGRIYSRDGVGLGSRMADFSIDYDENNCIQAVRVGYYEKDVLRENPAFVAFLNSRFNVDAKPLDDLTDLADLEITYKTGIGFGSPRELGQKVWSAPASDGHGEMVWIKINESEFRLYCDMPPEDEYDNTLWAKTRLRTHKDKDGNRVIDSLVIDFDQSVREETTDLDLFGPFCALLPLMDIPKTIYFDPDASRHHPLKGKDVNTPGYRELVTEYPNVETIKKSLALNGMTDVLRTRIRDAMANAIPGAALPSNMVDRGDSFAIFVFDDIVEAAKECGDDTTKSVIDTIENGGSFDDYPPANDDQRADLWDALTAAQQKAVVEWIFSESPQVDRDDFSDHDFSNSSDFLELFHEAEDPHALDMAFDRGVETAYRYGAEDDMSKALEKGVKDSGLLFWDDKTQDYTRNEIVYDTKCAYFVPYAPIIEWFDEDDTDDDINRNCSDLKSELGWKIEVSEPYYGFSGYDDDAGKEDFLEALFEADIINR